MRGVIPRLARRLPLPRRLARGPLLCGEALPLALLLLALASVFAFGGGDRGVHRLDNHAWTSIQTLLLTGNYSPEQPFLGFFRKKLDEDGERQYVRLYNRFPVGSYAAVKLATLSAGEDPARQLRAARLLMLVFFAAAAALAYLALARLLGDRRIALAATLLAFSSYYALYYSDLISAEMSTNLFGVMLVFHGMALFAQEGRFRQLLIKTALAILLGWHVLGLIAPFVLFALGRELLAARADGGRLRSRAILVYGAFSALCAALALGFNFANEWRALGGEVPLHELPSFRSMLSRAGNDAALIGPVGWPDFLRGQLGGVGGAAIPFALVDRLGLDLAQPFYGLWPPPASAPPFAALGAAVLAVCLAGLRRLPHRTLFAALLLTGWCYAVAFRGSSAFHEFDAMFHLGFPLVLWPLALLGLRRLLGGERAAYALPAIAAASIAVFVLSAALASRIGHDAEAAARERETLDDFSAVRPLARGRSVVADLIDPVLGQRNLRNYYLAGSYLQIEGIGSAEEWRAIPDYDFVVLPADFGGSLTPDNARFHLYRLADLPNVLASITAREPAARDAFEVYLHLDGRSLVYVRDPCAGVDTGETFYLHLFPADARDLDPGRGPPGFNDITFRFNERGVRFGGACMAAFPLPDYELRAVRTGQYHTLDGPLWIAQFPLDPEAWLARRDALAAREPALRAAFDAHLEALEGGEGGALTFVREGCEAADTRDRFFVHVYAADPGDLPPERREAGFEKLDFWFGDRGLRYEGACMASVALPGYELRAVRTGQYDATGHLWDAGFAADAASWLARFEAAAAREPALRARGFGLHLDGRTLTWVREACSAADVEDRFFVHVHAADGGGRENLDFWFRQRGLVHGDRCMASVELPDYAERVVTGQYDASGHLWEAEIAVGASR